MRDWKTTLISAATAFFSFVLFSPEYFPDILISVSKFAFAGGLAWLGVSAADYRRARK